MKPHKAHWLAIVAALLAAAATNAWSSKVPENTVAGKVTVARADAVTVDGRVYRVKPGTQAAAAARQLTTGQAVEVQLSGPANAASSEAVGIHIR